LITYITLVSLAAIVVTVLAWRPLTDPSTLLIGFIATAVMAAFSVRTVSGVNASWSAAVAVHLGLSLSLGPPGAVAGAIADGLLGRALLGAGWVRCIFNAATFTLKGLAAWTVASAFPYQQHPALAPLAGIAAGVVAWAVNYGILAMVIRLASQGEVSVRRAVRDSLAVLPYEIAYGWAAAGVAVLFRLAGTAGFTMLLAPVVAGQAFLVLLARRTSAHQAELRQAEEAERRRIARDLHDTVVQVVAGSAMLLSAQADLPSDSPVSKELVRETASDLRSAAQDLRTLIVQIAPPTLDQDGLAVALGALLRPLIAGGISAHLSCPDHDLPLVHSQLIFRVAQEALRNVLAHAGATAVEITVTTDEGGTLLVIKDDGRGFSATDVRRRRRQGHIGTRGLAETAAQSGATLVIESEPGAGTSVRLTVPTSPR